MLRKLAELGLSGSEIMRAFDIPGFEPRKADPGVDQVLGRMVASQRPVQQAKDDSAALSLFPSPSLPKLEPLAIALSLPLYVY